MNKHKWHKEIKAWADGAEIEFRYEDLYKKEWSEWELCKEPIFFLINFEFRIKPQPVEVIAGQPFRFKEKKYLYAYIDTRFGKIEFSTEWSKTSAMPLIGKIEVQDD